MSKTYAQIVKQIDQLQREAETLRQREVQGVVDRIREAIAVYGLTAADLGLAAARSARAAAAKRPRKAGKGRRAGPAAKAPAVKFRDDAGHTWGGRGPRPGWLREALAAGKSLADFAV
ncbi:MAG: H-NS histone family protein [Burkholderiales bacterium]|nr:H-NS histone family protein [Burkholderiales bacterium]